MWRYVRPPSACRLLAVRRPLPPIHWTEGPQEGLEHFKPLVYCFGHTVPTSNTPCFKTLVDTMAQQVDERLRLNEAADTAGILIDTWDWADSTEDTQLIQHCIEAFKVDVVLVMSDKLHANLKAALSTKQSDLSLVLLPKSGGVVTRPEATRARIRRNCIKNYFYGQLLPDNLHQLSPVRCEVPLANFTFLQVGGATSLSEGMKVIGSSPDVSCRLVAVEPSPNFQNCIAAVLHDTAGAGAGEAAVPQHLLQSNVLGFVWILDINCETKKMNILCPRPDVAPHGGHLLVGSIKCLDKL